MDYTVNAAAGFPLVTGPVDHAGPVNHVLPAWDVCCGLYAALAIVAAVRRRDQSGVGAQISIALEDVALATAGNLGLLTEPQVNDGAERQRLGNAIYGQYGQDFISRDGAAFMVVTLTKRHFHDLVDVSGTGAAVAALAESLGADFADEGERYRYRDVLSGLFRDVVRRSHSRRDRDGALSATSVLFERYRSFAETAAKMNASDLRIRCFPALHQDGLGDYLAPGLPTVFDGEPHRRRARAHASAATPPTYSPPGLGMSAADITRLTDAKTIAC